MMRKRITGIVLSLLMVLTLIPTFALTALADEGDGGNQFGQILYNGKSEDWAHFYAVDGKDAKLTLEQLKLSVADNEGQVIDPVNYDLTIKTTWWEGEEHKEKTVTSPFGINAESAEDQSEGFSNFEVIVTYKAGTAYAGKGETKGEFYIMDKHSLNWICTDVFVPGTLKTDGFRMRNRYFVDVYQSAEPVVKNAAGELLTNGTDYTITWYERTGDVDEKFDESNPKGPEEYLVRSEEKKLDKMPTREGAYFFVLEAKDGSGYYGGTEQLVDLVDGDVWDQGGEEKDVQIEKVVFDGDRDYDWAHFYLVDIKKDLPMSRDDLNISVIDERGGVVDPDKYELTFYRTGWDEVNDRPLHELVGENSFDLGEEDFVQFAAVVKAKPESGYKGSVKNGFYIQDQYCLDYICCNAQFDRAYQAGGHQSWHDFYQFPYGYEGELEVRRNDGVRLEEGAGKDYTATYYFRNDQAGEEGGRYKEENALGGFPQLPGTYFVKIEGNGERGVSGYFGATYLDFDVSEYQVVAEGFTPFLSVDGEPCQITAKIMRYDAEQGNLVPFENENTLYRWYYNNEEVEVKDKNGKTVGFRVGNNQYDDASKGSEVTFTLARRGWGRPDITLLATDGDGAGCTQYGLLKLKLDLFSTSFEFPEGEDNFVFRDQTNDKVMYLELSEDVDFDQEFRYLLDYNFWDYDKYGWDNPDEERISFGGDGDEHNAAYYYETEYEQANHRIKITLHLQHMFERMAKESYKTSVIGMFGAVFQNGREGQEDRMVGKSMGGLFVRENIWFEYPDNSEDFWWDTEDKEVELHLRNIDPSEKGIAISAGARSEEGWDVLLEEGKDYEKTATDYGYLLSFNYSAIQSAYAAENVESDHLALYAAVYANTEYNWQTDQPEMETFGWINLKGADLNLDRQWDKQVLPGWIHSININNRYWYRDSKNPEGREGNYRVTNVEVVDQEEEEENQVVRVVEKHDDEWDEDYWDIEALRYGSATIRVTYDSDIEGENASYTYRVDVMQDVYRINFWPENGSWMSLPGSEITFEASVEHAHYNEEEERDGGWEPMEDARFDWTVEEGEDLVNGDLQTDGSKVTVKLKDSEDERLEKSIRLQAKAYDKDDQEVAEDSLRFGVAASYTQIYPLEIAQDTMPGETVTVNAEVKAFSKAHPEGERIPNVTWKWEDYDSRAITILDKEDKELEEDEDVFSEDGAYSFKIQRKETWGTDFRLTASWMEDGEEQREETEYRFDDLGGFRIWYSDEQNRHLFDDGSLDVTLSLDDSFQRLDEKAYPYSFEYAVGLWDNDHWETEFTKDTDYTENGKTVTLDGEKLFAKYGDCDFRIEATAFVGEGEQKTEVYNTDVWINLRESWTDYRLPDSRDMLPGWDDSIDNRQNGRVENTAFPDGLDFAYEITGVEVVSQEPEESGETVVSVQKETDNNDVTHCWWKYRAENYGNADLKITYKNPQELIEAGFPETDTYQFRVQVTRDVYRVEVDTESGSDRVLSGGTVRLVAKGYHDTDYEVQEGEEEKLGYTWEVEDWEKEDVTVTQDPADPSKATAVFRTLTEEELEEGFWQDFPIRVILTGDEGTERARNEIRITLAHSYTDIYPLLMDGRAPVGTEQEIEAEVRRYPSGNPENENGYEVVPNVDFRWSFNEDDVEIKDAEGNPVEPDDKISGNAVKFTVKRKNEGEFRVRLRAEWNEDGETRNEEREYRFERLDYNMNFRRDGDNAVYQCGTKDYMLLLSEDAAALVDSNEASVAFTVGIWGDDNWTETFKAGTEYSVDGLTVRLKGAELAKHDGLQNVRVYAKLLGKDETCLNDCDVWVDLLREHNLSETPAKAASCTEAGNNAYWTCSVCTRYFSDAEGKNEILENSWIIPAGHTWGDWTYLDKDQHQRVCGKDASHKEQGAHQWNEGEVTTPATCEAAGEKMFTCTVCGGTKTEEIPPAGHAWGDWTYLDKDQHQRVCGKDASHKEQGAHQWNDGEVTTPATSEAAGEKTFTCTVCGGTKVEEIPPVEKAAQTITTSATTYNKTYGNSSFSLGAKTSGDGKLTYATSNAKVAVVSASGVVSIKGVGTATITITAAETASYKAASKKVTVKVNKVPNPLKVTAAKRTAKGVSKKNVTVAGLKVSKKGQGKMTYTKVKVNKLAKNFTVNKKTGKITVKMGTKPGKYKVMISAKAAGNSNYKPSSVQKKVVTVTVKK